MSPSWMSELLTLSLRLSQATLRRKPISPPNNKNVLVLSYGVLTAMKKKDFLPCTQQHRQHFHPLIHETSAADVKGSQPPCHFFNLLFFSLLFCYLIAHLYLSLYIHSTSSQQMLGGTTCCNPDEFLSCERDPAISPVHYTSGRCDGTTTVYNSCTHVCCGGQVSHRGWWRTQLHGSAELHCCGSQVYQPNTEICCNGHKYPRHTREANMRCCGTQAYSIQNQQMVCCAGTLYNLTLPVQSKLEVKCCGSLLQQAHHICCSSGEEEVLYSNKKGFGCCGHQYFNASLWSCCAGKLHPVNQTEHHPDQIIKDVVLRSVYNLERSHLCNGIFLGTVESVSPHSVLFIDVLKINGTDGVVTPLPLPYIMKKPDCCSFLPLSPGKTYFYDENNIFAAIDPQATLQSVHSIISSLCR